MALDVNIVQNIDKTHVKVEAKSSHMPTRYFKVEKNNADAFCANYKKEARRNSTRNYISMFISVVGACGVTGLFTKNQSKTLQRISGIIAGIVGLAGATLYSTKKAISNEDKMLKQHNATEILQTKKKMPI